VKWNDNEHSIKLTGEKDATLWVELTTASSFASADGLLLRFDHVKTGKVQRSTVKASYKSQVIAVDAYNNNGKPKEGSLVIATPWSCVNEVKASYQLNLGKEVNLASKLSLNGEDLVDAKVDGHILKNDVKLDFEVAQKDVGKAKGGFQYELTPSQTKLKTHFEYGVHSIKTEGFYMAMPLTIKVAMDMKTRSLPVQYELNLFNGYGAVDINTFLSVDNRRVGELGWNSWFGSLVDHRLTGQVQLYENQVFFQATNAKGNNIDYELTYTVDKEVHSKAKLSLERQRSSEGRMLNFAATLSAVPLKANKETSIIFKHKTTVNVADTHFEITAMDKVVSLVHRSSWNFAGRSQNVNSEVKLETPFPYLTSATGTLEHSINDQPGGIRGINATAYVNFKHESTEEDFLRVTVLGSRNEMTGRNELSTKAKGPWGLVSLNGACKTGQAEWTFTDTEGQEFHIEVMASQSKASLTLYTPFFDKLTVATELDTSRRGHVLTGMQVFFPNTWLDVHLNAEWNCDDMNGNVNGKLSVPGLGIDTWTVATKANVDTKASTLEAQFTLEAEKKQPVQISAIASWTGPQATLNMVATKEGTIYSFTSSVQPLGDMKHLMVKLSHDDKYFLLEVLGHNSDDVTKAELTWETQCSSNNIFALKAHYNKPTQEWAASYQNNDKLLNFNGGFDTSVQQVYKTYCRLENNVIPSLANFSVQGSVDLRDRQAAISFTGVSNDGSHIVTFTATMEASKGNIQATATLPIIGMTSRQKVKINYNIDVAGGDLVVDANGSTYDAHWENDGHVLSIVLQTPSPSLKEVKISRSLTSTQQGKNMGLTVVVNSVEAINAQASMVYYRSVGFSLKTPLQKLQTLEVAFDAESLKQFKFVLNYNDEVDVRLSGKLSADYMKADYTVKFSVPQITTPYSASFAYNLVAEVKAFGIQLHGDSKSIMLDGLLASSHSLLTVDSWLCGGVKSFEATWDLEKGIVKVIAKSNEAVVHETIATYSLDGQKSYAGSANFTTTLPFASHPTFIVYSRFDIGGLNKNADIMAMVADHFVTMSTIYHMTEDTFNGELLWKSSMPGYETAILNAKYNIATEPTASVTLERNGRMDFIKTKLSFDNIIPTVYITTSFPGLQKLIFKGNYEVMGNRRQVDIMLTCNDENLLVLANKVTMSDDLTNFELISNILTPIPGWTSLNLEVGWKQQDDPYAIKVKFVREGIQYSIKGRLSFDSKEFLIGAVSPFEGYESINLSGKFGTTSIGKQFGVSFEQNAVRRDVSMAYGIDENNVAMVRVKTPLERYKSIKLRSMMMADMGRQMDFGFETSGVENDFAFGVKYDFSRGLANGMVLIKTKAAPLSTWMSDLEAKVEYTDMDGDLSNGFGGLFYFSKDGQVIASGKINRTPGHTKAQLKTPVPGYERLDLELKSDYQTNILMVYQQNDDTTSLDVQKTGAEDYDITIKTPARGYETITATYRKTGTVSVVTVARNGKKISSITVDASMDLQAKKAMLALKWEATQHLWAEVSMSFDNDKGEFTLKAPNKDWKFTMEHSDDGTTSKNNIDVNMDGKTMTYVSKRVWTEGNIAGESKFRTTIDYFEIKSQDSNYLIKYSEDFSTPLEIDYKTTNDGEINMHLKLKFALNLGEGFDFGASLSMPSILPDDISVELSVMTDMKSVLKISGRYNTMKVALQLECNAKDASITLSTNIPGFERIQGKAVWVSSGSKTKVDYFFEMNGQRLIEGFVGFDQFPFTRFKFAVRSGEISQELAIKWTPSNRGDQYHLQVTTSGMSNLAFDGMLNLGKGNEKLDLSLKGTSYSMGPVDCALMIGLKHIDGDYGLVATLKHDGVPYTVKFQFGVKSPLIAKGKATAEMPNGHGFEAVLDYNMESRQKTFEMVMSTHGEKYAVTGEIEWAPQASNIKILAVAGSQRIEFNGKRDGFKQLNYMVDVLGQRITLANTNDVRSSKDFDILASLSLPSIPGMRRIKDMKLTLNGESTGPDSMTAKGSLTEGNEAVTFNYQHTDNGKEFELQLVIPSMRELLVKYQKEGDGMLLTFSWDIFFWGHFHVAFFENVSLSGRPINIYIKTLQTNAEINLKVSIQEKTMDLLVRQGGEFFKLNGQAKINDNKFDVSLQGSTDENSDVFSVNAVVTYPLNWHISFRGPVIFDIDVGASDNYSGTLAFTFKRDSASGNGTIDLAAKVTMVNTETEKSAELKLANNGQTLTLIAASTPGKLKFELISPVAALDHLDFEAEFDAQNLKVKFEYEGSEIGLDMGYNEDGEFFFEAKILDENKIVGKLNTQDKKFTFNSVIGGQEIAIDARYSNGNLIITATEPFTSGGTIKFDGQWEKTANGATLKAIGDINAINYSLEVIFIMADKKEVRATMAKGTDDWTLKASFDPTADTKEAKLSVSGTRIEPFEVTGTYQLTDVKFTAALKAVIPSNSAPTEALIEADFDYPRAIGLKAKALHNGETVFDTETGIKATENYSNIRLVVTALVPPMGLKSGDFGFDLVYRTISLYDFEYKALVSWERETVEASVKFHQTADDFLAEARINFGKSDMFFKVGGSLKEANGVVHLTGVLNNSELKVDFDPANLSINAALSAKHLIGKKSEDLLFKLLFADNGVQEMNMDVIYNHGDSLKLDAKVDTSHRFLAAFTFNANTISGALTLKTPTFQRSSEIVVHYGDEGRIEITVGGLQQHKMSLQLRNDGQRVARAAFHSPTFGYYEFEMDQGVTSGILVLSTGSGIHKISYEVTETQDYEITVHLESPLLSNGHATLQLAFDTRSDIYRGRVAFNNDHFVAMAIGWNDNSFDASLSLESTLLAGPMGGLFKLEDAEQAFTSIATLTLFGKHTVEVIVDKKNIAGKLIASSPLMPGQEIVVEGHLHSNGIIHELGAMLLLAGEKIQFSGNINYNNCHDFEGDLLYHGSSMAFAKAKLNYVVHLHETKSTFDFDMTTAHPDIPRARMMMDFEGAVEADRYIGFFSVITPLDTLSTVDGKLTFPKRNMLLKNEANALISTPNGEYQVNTKWNLQDSNQNSAEIWLDGPNAAKVVVKMIAHQNDLTIELDTNLEMVQRANLHLLASPNYGLAGGSIQAVATWDDDRMEAVVDHEFSQNAKHLRAMVNSPFEGQGRYEFNVGYEDTNRKTVKAHMQCPKGESGFQFDYHFSSVNDFMIHAEVDLPIPGLKVNAFQFGNTLSNDAHAFVIGGEWSETSALFNSRIKLDLNVLLLDVNVQHNDYSSKIRSFFSLSDMKLETSIEAVTPWGPAKLTQNFRSNDGDFELSLEHGGVRNLYLRRNADSKTVSVEVRDIYFKSAVKASLTQAHDNNGFVSLHTVEVIWDTNNEKETTEMITVSVRKTEMGGDFNAQIMWPSKHTDTIKGNLERRPGKLLGSLSILQGSNKILGFELSALSEFSGNVSSQT
jgi:hypothetical protein